MALPISRIGGAPYAVYLTAAQPNCGHCGQPPRLNTPIHCVGPPYCVLLHEECLPLYDYEDRKWPHAHPLVAFTKPRTYTYAIEGAGQQQQQQQFATSAPRPH